MANSAAPVFRCTTKRTLAWTRPEIVWGLRNGVLDQLARIVSAVVLVNVVRRGNRIPAIRGIMHSQSVAQQIER